MKYICCIFKKYISFKCQIEIGLYQSFMQIIILFSTSLDWYFNQEFLWYKTLFNDVFLNTSGV